MSLNRNYDINEFISNDVLTILEENGYVPVFINRRKHRKYRKDKSFLLTRHYDLLENFRIVRVFIQKKNNIVLEELEMLLFFHPKGAFTFKEFMLQYPYRKSNIDKHIEKELIDIVYPSRYKSKRLYKTSSKARTIVTQFYKLLSGESTHSLKSVNPLKGKEYINGYDNKLLQAIKKLGNEGPQKTKEIFYSKEKHSYDDV